MEPFRIASVNDRPATSTSTHGVDPGDISRSWQRCRSAGLTPEQSRMDHPHFSSAERRMAAERRATLITQARPVMEYFYGQIKDSGCVMLLSDETGYLLESAGDLDFCTRAFLLMKILKTRRPAKTNTPAKIDRTSPMMGIDIANIHARGRTYALSIVLIDVRRFMPVSFRIDPKAL